MSHFSNLPDGNETLIADKTDSGFQPVDPLSLRRQDDGATCDRLTSQTVRRIIIQLLAPLTRFHTNCRGSEASDDRDGRASRRSSWVKVMLYVETVQESTASIQRCSISWLEVQIMSSLAAISLAHLQQTTQNACFHHRPDRK